MRRREFNTLLGERRRHRPYGRRPSARRSRRRWSATSALATARRATTGVAAFRQGLSETGYVEGQNVAIEYRWAEGRYDRLPALAADLVGRKVDVIVAARRPCGTRGEKRNVDDPDRLHRRRRPGRARSGRQSRPAGRQPHGRQLPRSPSCIAKRLELLSELVPQARVIALLVNPNSPTTERIMRDVQEAARAKGCSSLS